MLSRRYTIFEIGSNGELFGEYQTLIGPEKLELVCEGFMGFFMQRLSEARKKYVVFTAPVTLEEDVLVAAQDPLTIKYWTTGKDPQFNEERILRRLFPQFDDVMEIFDENKINFAKILPIKRIKLSNLTTAWNS